MSTCCFLLVNLRLSVIVCAVNAQNNGLIDSLNSFQELQAFWLLCVLFLAKFIIFCFEELFPYWVPSVFYFQRYLLETLPPTSAQDGQCSIRFRACDDFAKVRRMKFHSRRWNYLSHDAFQLATHHCRWSHQGSGRYHSLTFCPLPSCPSNIILLGIKWGGWVYHSRALLCFLWSISNCLRKLPRSNIRICRSPPASMAEALARPLSGAPPLMLWPLSLAPFI